MRIFDKEKRKQMKRLQHSLALLKRVKKPRQSILKQIQALDLQLDEINPFVSEEAEEKFWRRMERDL